MNPHSERWSLHEDELHCDALALQLQACFKLLDSATFTGSISGAVKFILV